MSEHQHKHVEDKPKELSYDELKSQLLALTKTVANLDVEVKKMQETRAGVMKELRSVQNKVTTLDMKKALAA